MPYITIIPALLGAIILFTYAFRLIKAHQQPTWTKPFLKENKEEEPGEELGSAFSFRPVTATLGLLVGSTVGLTMQIVSVLIPRVQTIFVYPAVAWVVAITIIVFERPRTAPMSLLTLYTGLFLERLILSLHTQKLSGVSQLPLVLPAVAALFNLLVIINMPLRDPELSSRDISPTFTDPTATLRTPEDNLTPWQFMTVSWMRPLINKGNSKDQFNDEDVWDLGWEFKHARLHNAFRVLQGSVTRRLLVANGMDLVRMTVLALIQSGAMLLTPVLLQRLLASMNDPNSTRSATVIYAVISLVFRLVSAQSAVFSLWYQRRAYERSRGEMITMLYEKTLNRKILGAKQELPEEIVNGTSNGDTNGHANGETNGSANQTKAQRTWLVTTLLNVFSLVRAPFSKKPPKKKEEPEPASMGKILNLMRNDVYEVSQRFWEFSDIITKPFGAIIATVLIWLMLGWSCLLGALALLFTQFGNVAIARGKVYFEKKRRVATDEKLKRVNQFIESIRHLRWYGWQGTYRLLAVFQSCLTNIYY